MLSVDLDDNDNALINTKKKIQMMISNLLLRLEM